jgi:hypothetical protein
MKKILLILSIGFMYSQFTYADTTSQRPQSVLFLDQEQSTASPQQSQYFDFSSSLQQKREEAIKQNESSYLQMNQNQANTANMSDFERSQYYLKSHNNEGLRTEQNIQNWKSLEQAKNRGAISNKEYNKGISKIGRLNNNNSQPKK